MECGEFLSRLNEILDQRSDPESDPPLAAHAAECAVCSQSLSAAGLLLDAVRSSTAVPFVDGFSNRVVERLQTEQGAARPESWAQLLVAAALAASVLFLAWPAIARRDVEPLRGELALAVSPTASALRESSDRAATSQDNANAADANASSMSSFYLASSLLSVAPLPLPDLRDRGEDLAEIVILQIPAVRLASFARSSDRLTSKSREWVNNAADGLKPLTSPVAEAIENLRWVMPRLRGEHPS